MGHNDERLLRPGWLGKKESGKPPRKQLIDKSSITRPVRIQASVSPVPASVEELRKLSYLAVPKPPKIDTRNLGTANEALHSHPTGMLLARLDRGSSHSDREIKNWHRKLVICERDDDDYILLKGPGPSKGLLGGRQQGNVFRKSENAEANVEERVKKTIDRTIPAIRLVPPPEEDFEQLGPQSLSVDEAYKVLFRRSERENRGLKGLLPLAWLLAEAEGVDIHDTRPCRSARRHYRGPQEVTEPPAARGYIVRRPRCRFRDRGI